MLQMSPQCFFSFHERWMLSWFSIEARPSLLVRIALILGSVIGIGRFAVGDEPPPNSKEIAASIYRTAMENNLAIQNSEVRIVEDYLYVPQQKTLDADIAAVSQKKVSRIVVDRIAERCVLLSFLLEEHENGSKSDDARKPIRNERWFFREYQDGVSATADFSIADSEKIFNVGSLRKEKKSFDEFCIRSDIPNFEFWCFYPIDTKFFGRENTIFNHSRFATGDVAMRRLPDGTVKLIHSYEKAGITSTVDFDAKTRMPFRTVSVEKKAESIRVIDDHTTSLESVNGIYRPTHISTENEGLPRSVGTNVTLENVQASIRLFDRVGTVDIEWMQFNETALQFPDINTILKDEAQRARFLKVDLMDLHRKDSR